MLSPHRVVHPPHGRGTAQHLHHHTHRLNVHRSQGTFIGTNSVNSGNIAPNSIDGTNDIIAGSITSASIATFAINAGLIAAGAITTGALAAGSVTAFAIATGALSAYVFSGNSITLAASGTQSSKVLLDQTGIRMYNSAGVQTNTFDSVTGSLTVTSGSITGATIQTSAGTTSKVMMDSNGLRAYDAIGNQTFNLDTSGNLSTTKGTITGATVQTSSGSSGKVMMDTNGLRAYDAIGNQTVTIDTAGNLTMARGSIVLSTTVPAGSSPRVTMDPTGIKAYNGSNTQTFLLDATTGLIQCTGVITATGGSSVPAGVVTGSLPGSANRYSNSSFQNGAGVFDFTGWACVNGLASSGATAVPPVYGQLTCRIQASGVAAPGAPGLTLVNVAGNLGVGQYRYVVTFRTGTGETSFIAGQESTITTTTGGQQVTVALPLGPTGVTARAVYRTVLGGATGTEKLVAVINNNTATTFTDNVADTGLGAAVPGTNTSVSDVQVIATQVTDPYKRVVPGLGYSFSHYIWPFTAARSNRIDVRWYDVNGALLSTTTGPVQTPIAGQWNRVTATAVSPANAAFALGVHYVGLSAVANNVFYIDGFQMEQGDVPSAWAPRPDEILYASISAQQINVGTLSAISANLGTINAGSLNSVSVTAGTITGSTISGTTVSGGTVTGATVQTASSNPRTVLDITGMWVTDSNGNQALKIDQNMGVQLLAGQGGINSISWAVGPTLLGIPTMVSYLFADQPSWIPNGYRSQWVVGLPNQGADTGLQIFRDPSADSASYISVVAQNVAGGIASKVLLRGDGTSDYAPNSYHARAYKANAWGPTAANTWYLASLDSVDVSDTMDTSRWFNGSYSIPYTGWYRVAAAWTVGVSANPTIFMIGIAINGSIGRISSHVWPAAIAAATASIECGFYAHSGDAIDLFVGNGSAGITKSNIGVAWSSNFMEIWRVG